MHIDTALNRLGLGARPGERALLAARDAGAEAIISDRADWLAGQLESKP